MVKGMHVELSHLDEKEFFRIFEWLLRHRKEFHMAQVQFSATFTVAPAVQPLAVTPPSGAFSFTVGKPVDGVLATTISGGVPPYSTALDSTSGPLPTGVTFNAPDASGNVTYAGTPTTAGTSTTPVVLDVNDSAA